jgi:hypothetical protein
LNLGVSDRSICLSGKGYSGTSDVSGVVADQVSFGRSPSEPASAPSARRVKQLIGDEALTITTEMTLPQSCTRDAQRKWRHRADAPGAPTWCTMAMFWDDVVSPRGAIHDAILASRYQKERQFTNSTST